MTLIYTNGGTSIGSINLNTPLAEGGVPSGGAEASTAWTYGFGIGFNFLGTSIGPNPEMTPFADSFGAIGGTTAVLAFHGTGIIDQGGGVLTGTTLYQIYQTDALNNRQWEIAGSVDATAFYAAEATAGTADDQALIASLLTGDDLIFATTGSGTINSGAGRDYVLARDGNVTTNGGGGGDLLVQDFGHGRLVGAGGNDILVSNDGQLSVDYDIMNGGLGNDSLMVLGGHAVVTGGAGSDKFLVGPDALRVVITDFSPTADTLFLPGVTALSDLTIRHVAAGMLIQTATTDILLKGVAASDFHATDLVLHDASAELAQINSFFANFHFLT